MDSIMAIKKLDKIKTLQTALAEHEVLKDVLPKLNQKQVEAVEQVVADVIFALAKEDKVKFADLGDFEVKATAARTGINPAKFKELTEQGVDKDTAKAQASIELPAGQKLGFSQSSTIKAELKA